MATATHVFVVEGSGKFPLDMLRRDKCYPRNEGDSNELERDHRAGRRVCLERVVIGERTEGAHWQPTIGRWESFGWRVVEWYYVDPRGVRHGMHRLEV